MSVIKSGDNAKIDQEKAKVIDILAALELRKNCGSDQMPKDYWIKSENVRFDEEYLRGANVATFDQK